MTGRGPLLVDAIMSWAPWSVALLVSVLLIGGALLLIRRWLKT
jgi:hypothetical protein